MYDPAIVDAFVAAHERLMPTETPMHPAARAVGGARSRERAPALSAVPAPAAAEPNASGEVLGVSSLARALAGEANLADAGALSWMMLKQVLPCTSMGLFVPEERNDTVVGCYAAGSHAGLIRSLRASPGDGIVGWVAGHRRTAVNAEPALDFGLRVASLEPPLLSALAVPLLHDGRWWPCSRCMPLVTARFPRTTRGCSSCWPPSSRHRSRLLPDATAPSSSCLAHRLRGPERKPT